MNSIGKNLINETWRAILLRIHLKTFLGGSLYLNSFYFILAYSFTEGAGFIFWILAARVYSSADAGLAASAISASMLLATFSSLGLSHAFVKFLPNVKGEEGVFINSGFISVLVVSGLSATIFLVGMNIWSSDLASLRQHAVLVTGFLVFVMFASMRPLLLNVFMADRRGHFVLAVGTFDGLLKLSLILALPLILVGTLRSFGIFLAWGISMAVPVIAGILLWVPRVYPRYRPWSRFQWSSIHRMLRFSMANYVSELSWFSPASGLIGWVIVLLIANLIGMEETAYFYVVWLFAAFLNVIPVSISTSLLAEGAHDGLTVYRNAKRSLKLATLFLIPVIVIIFLIGDKILLLFGIEYSENATTLLRVLSVSSLPLAFNTISLGIWRVQSKLRPILGIGITIALISLSLTFLLNSSIGILSPGIAWLVAQTVAAVTIGRIAWNRADSEVVLPQGGYPV